MGRIVFALIIDNRREATQQLFQWRGRDRKPRLFPICCSVIVIQKRSKSWWETLLTIDHVVRITVADGDTQTCDSDDSLLPCHHPRVDRSAWGVQMSNGTPVCTHAFKKKKAACTAHSATGNNRCRRQTPLWSHLNPTLGLNIARMLQAWQTHANLPGSRT